MMNNISLWFSLVRKSFKMQSVYRLNIIVSFLGGLLLIFVQSSVWQALYAQGEQGSSTITETITYVILSTIFLPSISILPGRTIGQSIYSGDIGVEMVRPVSLLAQHIGSNVGKQVFTLVTYALPTTVVAAAIFGLVPPKNALSFLMFLVSSFVGVIIYMLIDTLGGYTAFWLYNNWYISWFERALFALFGATVIPMWFYPAWLSNAAKYLPFQYISFTPINIYLGKTGISEYITILLIQVFWVLLLFGAERYVWHRAQRKIVVQGG